MPSSEHSEIDLLTDEVLRLRREGCYEKALPAAHRACQLAEQNYGSTHPLSGLCLNNLGSLYLALGNFAAAEPLVRRALRICRITPGSDHPEYALLLNNLGSLYHGMGNYAAAVPLFQQAIELLRGAQQGGDAAYPLSLRNLAHLEIDMGHYESAAALSSEAIRILRESFGEDDPNYALGLATLAEVYCATNNFATAEPLFRQRCQVAFRTLGMGHPTYALCLNDLGELHRAMGDYGSAESLLQQAMQIHRETLGTYHPTYAVTLNNMALVNKMMGNFTAAESLYRQTLEIDRKMLGSDHPDFAKDLCNLSAVTAALGRMQEAIDLMEQAATIHDRLIGQVASIGSESQRAHFLQTVRGTFEAFLSLLVRRPTESPIAARAGLEMVLRRKGVVAETLAIQRDTLLGGSYPVLEPKLKELNRLRWQVAYKTLAGPGSEDPKLYWQTLTQLDARRERLEAELAGQIPEINLARLLRATDRRAIASVLPDDAALAEFVRFRVFNFDAVPARGGSEWGPERYVAFVLVTGDPDEVRMFDLGEAEPIDRLIAEFRASITGESEHDANRDMVKAKKAPIPPEEDRAGRVLRAAVFDRLAAAFQARKRLFLAPAGDLTRLPFEALPTDDGRRLIDDYSISYIACGRDTLRFHTSSTGQPTEALVAADPDFDLRGDGKATSRQPDAAASRQSRDLDQTDLSFDRLLGTRREGQQIAQLLNVRPWLQSEVLEQQLKQARSPWILHLATHGFFLEDQQYDHAPGQRGLGMLGDPMGGPGRLAGPLPENPLLRSGLALAGANTWLRKGELPAEAEDGLLTAEDVTGLDLLDTELVVLSACDTGLGEIRVGEGVFGLRRAFVLAGAKTLIMSLWKVPDEPTRELMEDFYQRIMAGVGRADALRGAQLSLKAKYPEPFYWGAFICQGDPGPLEGHRAARQRPAKKIDERESS